MPNNLGKFLHPKKARTTDIKLPSPQEQETEAIMLALADKRGKDTMEANKANRWKSGVPRTPKKP